MATITLLFFGAPRCRFNKTINCDNRAKTSQEKNHSPCYHRIHVNGDVGGRRCVIPECKSAVLVQENGHGVSVGKDARYVWRRREAANQLPTWILPLLKQPTVCLMWNLQDTQGCRYIIWACDVIAFFMRTHTVYFSSCTTTLPGGFVLLVPRCGRL